jgi:peptide/nickel transport system ATP-binding protein
MSEILKVNNLKVVYQTDFETVHAVNGISFEIKEKETLGIVGETGAGKTTTALSVMRLLPERTGRIVEGDIIFKGNNLKSLNENDMRKIRGKHIAMVFQDPMTSLNPVFSIGKQIGESILLHNKNNSKKEIEDRVDEVLKLVGLSPERKNEYPHQFSGGMRQRVVIAMALACNPEIIIADEPTTALDVTIQAQVLLMIRELRNLIGTSMIIITHDLGIVALTCDKVAVMYAGQFVESGTVEDIFNKNKEHHPYTTGLFNSIPNLDYKTKRLMSIPGLMPDPTNLPTGCSFFLRCPDRLQECEHGAISCFKKGSHAIYCNLFS